MKSFTAHAAILAASALTAYGSCTSAWADSNLELRSITVHFGDLNTDSPGGAAMLYTRIRIAAETVCGDQGPIRSLVLLSRYASCVHGAIGAAVASVNRPAVTEYALARGITPDSLRIVTKAGAHAHPEMAATAPFQKEFTPVSRR